MGSLIHLIFFLLIGLAAGWLAGRITKGKSYGLVNDLIVGVVGAFLGGILFSLIGLSASGLIGSQGLRITIAMLGYMGSFVSRANPDFCHTVLRLSDSVVTNTGHCYLRNII